MTQKWSIWRVRKMIQKDEENKDTHHTHPERTETLRKNPEIVPK